MDTTQRQTALSYWRYAAVGLFCLAFDYLFLTFWLAATCYADGGDCYVGPDTARNTVIGTGSLLVLGTVFLYFACRRRRASDRGDDGQADDGVGISAGAGLRPRG